jgi:hypothetical protein
MTDPAHVDDRVVTPIKKITTDNSRKEMTHRKGRHVGGQVVHGFGCFLLRLHAELLERNITSTQP